jgi:hypothetical protein
MKPPAWVAVAALVAAGCAAGQPAGTPAPQSPTLLPAETASTEPAAPSSLPVPPLPAPSPPASEASPPLQPPPEAAPPLPPQEAPPPAKAAAPPAAQCDPNYSGACVPIASDVDCAGGSGDGPAYVRGPVYVVGKDIYDLDRDGNGVGCER